MVIRRLYSLLALFLLTALPLLADDEGSAILCYDFTWPKNQVAMRVPGDLSIVQETDSLIQLQGPNIAIYLVVEDRSMVSEESCAQYIFDDVKRHNGTFVTEPYYNMKERVVGCYYIATYPHEDVGEALMADACFIDRISRRIFTAAVYCSHDYDDVIKEIISSLTIINEPPQY